MYRRVYRVVAAGLAAPVAVPCFTPARDAEPVATGARRVVMLLTDRLLRLLEDATTQASDEGPGPGVTLSPRPGSAPGTGTARRFSHSEGVFLRLPRRLNRAQWARRRW